MLPLEFISWWYGRGWRQLATNINTRLNHTARMFSATILLKTLFAPWKRIVTNPGRSLDAKFQAMMDNLVSRTIGFIVRILVLLLAGIVMLLVSIVSIIELVLWPLLPLAAIISLIKGLV